MSDKQVEAALAGAIIKKRPAADQTYFGRAMAEIGIDPLDGAYVIGSEPQARPPLPAPAYAIDSGVEAPTGELIDWVADVSAVDPTPGQLMQAQQEGSEG